MLLSRDYCVFYRQDSEHRAVVPNGKYEQTIDHSLGDTVFPAEGAFGLVLLLRLVQKGNFICATRYIIHIKYSVY